MERKCSNYSGIVKNKKAKHCWNCYNTIFRKQTQHDVSKYSGKDNKHPNWKGGKWLYWRRKALQRDNYTCKMCGLCDTEIMDVDHIIPKMDSSDRFKNEPHDINNLQTLCPNCHKRKTLNERKVSQNSAHLKSR